MKVKKSELVVAREKLYSSQELLKEHLTAARSKVQDLLSSPHFSSKTKDAINAELTHYSLLLLLIGTVSGVVAGAIAGTAFGTFNTLGKFWKPRFYDDIKKGAYGLYDGARELGKATIARTGDIVNSASKTIQNTGKAIGNVLGSVRMPKLSWR